MQLAQNLARYGKIGFIEQDFENCIPLEKTGYLDYTYGGKRCFIGDMRYWAGKNTSPGFAGPLTADITQNPAIIDLHSIDGRGFGVYLDERGKIFMIARRTGVGWPDEPLARGKVDISFDVYKTSLKHSSSLLTVAAMTLNGNPTPNNIKLKFDQDSKVLIDSQGKWIPSKYSVPNDVWASVKVNVDFNTDTCVLMVNEKKADALTTSFDAAKGAFNGLEFRCNAGAVYLDNIKLVWSW